MSSERGASVGDYQAPLFFAWQLTNRCEANCLPCCEESGPDQGWKGELSKKECLRLARDIVASRIPYAAFGGGEPLGVPHFWEVIEILHQGGVELKLETNGLSITEEKADILQDIRAQSVQISVDGATPETFRQVRPLGDYDGVLAAIRRLVVRGMPPEFVFVPNRINVGEIGDAYDLAANLGCRTFVTGPMMRLGRAARSWKSLGLGPGQWKRAEAELKERAISRGEPVKLSIYPWDILTEMRERLVSPQAMLLVVPNGKVKLLNALPFSPADLRQDGVLKAWDKYQAAWKSDEVRDFIETCQTDHDLLLHANETWPMGKWSQNRAAAAPLSTN